MQKEKKEFVFKAEAVIVGRVAATPQVKTAKNGKKIVKFPVAVPHDDTAEFFNITCFGKIAENAEKYLKKGKEIEIAGRLTIDKFEKDGVKHTRIYIIANRTKYLS